MMVVVAMITTSLSKSVDAMRHDDTSSLDFYRTVFELVESMMHLSLNGDKREIRRTETLQ